MTKLLRLSQHRNQLKRRSPWILFGLIALWSLCMGIGLAQAFEPQNKDAQTVGTKVIGTVDPVTEEYALGQELYLANCATCHIGVSPAVLPTQIWEYLLNDNEHYGVNITLPTRFDSRLILDYLATYSRPYYATEVPTFSIERSRFFQALHPQVEFAAPPDLQTCVTCHPQVDDFNFRQLSPEWE
ncbi:MAG: diheme cytochrome C [Cyanobacteria bacterium J06635_15]